MDGTTNLTLEKYMKVFGWLFSWLFYGLGQIVSYPTHEWAKLFGWMYPIYNNLMYWSLRLSDRYDLGIWLTRQDKLDAAIATLKELMEEDDELTPIEIINFLLEDMDNLYIVQLAEQLKRDIVDQVDLGVTVAEKVTEAAIGNRTPGVIFMNPRHIHIGVTGINPPDGGIKRGEDFVLMAGSKQPRHEFKLDIIREPNNLESPCEEISLGISGACVVDEPGIVDKSITPTMENSFQEIPLTDEDYKNDVIFQVGKAYRHSGGGEMFIVGRAETTLWGNCLIAEEKGGSLKPVGEGKDYSANWHQIPLEEWNKNFS